MATLNLLYKREYSVNDYICVIIPTVGQVLDDEDEYYGMVSAFTAMPIDLMVQLDDLGIDFTQITDYDLFLLLFNGLKIQDTSLVFKNLNLGDYVITQSPQSRELFLYNEKDKTIIDRKIYRQISAALRKIHHIEKNKRVPANEDARKYMLQRERDKQRRRKNRNQISQMEGLIISMVNAPEYKYNFEDTKNLTVYQFNESVRQVLKRVDYDNRMFGIYSGTINPKDINQDELNWLIHK